MQIFVLIFQKFIYKYEGIKINRKKMIETVHPPILVLNHPLSRGGETGKRGGGRRSDLYIYRADSDTQVEKEYVNKRRRGGYVGQGMKSNESDWMDMNE